MHNVSNDQFNTQEKNEKSEPTFIRAVHDKDHPFTMISKQLIRDSSLSPKARFLLIYLLSYPKDWKIYVKKTADDMGVGEKYIYAAIKELIEQGYCQIMQTKEIILNK